VKFKLDENLPAELAADLRGLGHEADTVFEEGLAGAADQVVLAAARNEGRVLFTLDKGIASLKQSRRKCFPALFCSVRKHPAAGRS
jgi:predicted nuclease of predicted toxin-antitoxin system